MAEVQTSVQQAVSDAPHFKIVSKLDGVPAIHDTVAYAQYLVNSTQTTASLYNVALSIASRSYNIVSPVVNRSKPLLESADGLAVATFDRAEGMFPYAFKTPTQDLIGVKQGKAVYDARIAPLISHAQPVIQEVINKTTEINSALGARASAVVQSSGEFSSTLIEQLKQIASQGKTLPGHLIDSTTKVSGELKEIVLAKDLSVTDKTNKFGAYVIDHVKPVVDEIYNYMMGAKNKALDEASEAADVAGDKVNQAGDKVNEIANQ